MGRSITPTYRLECTGGDIPHIMGWRGRATPARLERYILDICRSSGIGGANEHIGKALGRIMNPPKSARIIRQSSGAVVAEWTHPPFLVI